MKIINLKRIGLFLLGVVIIIILNQLPTLGWLKWIVGAGMFVILLISRDIVQARLANWFGERIGRNLEVNGKNKRQKILKGGNRNV